MELTDWMASQRPTVDACLHERFGDAWPLRFQEATRYPLGTGGKRMRPLLSLAAVEAVGASVDDAAVGAAAAVELVHTYSLVHDDLPCMDDDDERRGRPTVHRVYDDGVAVLVGDALLTEAFRLLSELERSAETRIALVQRLATAAGHVGMIGGQAADVGLGGPVTELSSLRRLHAGKTGALITAAAWMGGRVAETSTANLAALQVYGEAVGLAFQMADDVLDADEDAGEDGPPSYVKLLGIEETGRQARALASRAVEAVAGLPAPSKLIALARYTVDRDH